MLLETGTVMNEGVCEADAVKSERGVTHNSSCNARYVSPRHKLVSSWFVLLDDHVTIVARFSLTVGDWPLTSRILLDICWWRPRAVAGGASSTLVPCRV